MTSIYHPRTKTGAPRFFRINLTSSSDAGRVTGTPHDYSHPENIRRENTEASDAR